jgi:hypothetical protein
MWEVGGSVSLREAAAVARTHTLKEQNVTPPNSNICFFEKKKGSPQLAYVCKKSPPPLKNFSITVVFRVRGLFVFYKPFPRTRVNFHY